MKEKNENKSDKDYVTLLSAIANTCLLYNNRSIMGQHIDFNLEQNSPGKMNDFRARSTFHELASEVDKRYYGMCNLEDTLAQYEATSSFFTDNFKRSFAIDLHNPESAAFEKKKQQIYCLLDYAYGEGDKEADWQRLAFLGQKQKLCEDFYGEKCLSRNISVPILLLLLLGILPAFTSTKGHVKNLLEDFRLLMQFLRSYSARQSDVLSDAPVITRFEKELKDRIAEQEKKGEKDANNALSRLDLIHQTDMFFFVLSSFSSSENITRSNRMLKTMSVDLDGIWVENENGCTNFWMIEQLDSGYFFHSFKKVHKTENTYLEHSRYECLLINDDVGPVAYIVHPSFFRSLVEKKDGTNLRMWALVKWNYDSTKLYGENKNKEVTSFSLTPTIYRGDWFPARTFFRVENEDHYADDLEKLPVVDVYADDNYRLENNLCAITHDAVYLEIPEYASSDLDEQGRFLMVPKTLDDALDDVRIDDVVGICRFSDGSLFFTIPNGMVYYKINNKAERNGFGMIICSQILSDLNEL